MLNFILCDNFFPEQDIENLREFLNGNIDDLFHQSTYGLETKSKYPVRNIDQIISKTISVPVTIIENQSSYFRKTDRCLIHYEMFNSPNEWCFFVAMEETTFNLHKHKCGADSALQKNNFDYKYTPDWDYYLNVLMKPNQGIFFRPWLFHSMEDGLTFNIKFTIDY
jgi:hypothetical protein